MSYTAPTGSAVNFTFSTGVTGQRPIVWSGTQLQQLTLTLDPIYMGTGTPDATTILRGDGAWVAFGTGAFATIANYLPLTGGALTGNLTALGYLLTVEYDGGTQTTALALDFLTNGGRQKVTLGGATVTVTIADGTTGKPMSCQLKVIQDGTGSRALAWAGSHYSASRWLGAAAAVAPLTTAASETIYNFYWDGAKWYQSGMHVGAA